MHITFISIWWHKRRETSCVDRHLPQLLFFISERVSYMILKKTQIVTMSLCSYISTPIYTSHNTPCFYKALHFGSILDNHTNLLDVTPDCMVERMKSGLHRTTLPTELYIPSNLGPWVELAALIYLMPYQIVLFNIWSFGLCWTTLPTHIYLPNDIMLSHESLWNALIYLMHIRL